MPGASWVGALLRTRHWPTFRAWMPNVRPRTSSGAGTQGIEYATNVNSGKSASFQSQIEATKTAA